jgi:hypothetical protein
MTVERAGLSSSLERMVAVPEAPAVQGQSPPEDKEGKSRRRPPPPEDASAEPSEPSEQDSDPPQHRIDSLA